MADLGKIVITDGGTYSASIQYEKLTIVRYNNATWLSLQDTKGNAPADTSAYWRIIAKDGEDGKSAETEISNTTTFNDDGSITKTRTDGTYTTTVFNDDGSITETTYDAKGAVTKTKNTTFNDDGSITEVIE